MSEGRGKERRPRWLVVLMVVAAAAPIVDSSVAWASIRRLALVVGHNLGNRDDPELRYAEQDARSLAGVLRELGSFDRVKLRTGIAANDVVREIEELQRSVTSARAAKDQVLVLFYYSGHADGQDLHLGGSLLPGDELVSRMNGLGADLRLIILDACQSGDLTRRKGLLARPPLNVTVQDELPVTGQALLAATSPSENAQESTGLRGSFFTTSLITGLRGAADANQDGQVSLREAFEFAYHRTVRATVSSMSGIQHPSYSLRLSGQRDVTLTWPARSPSQLSFKARSPGTFVVLNAEESLVLAELSATVGLSRRIGLPPGTYLVKKRSAEGVLIGQVRLPAGGEAILDESQMQRVPYVLLARKGRLPPGAVTLVGSMAMPVLGTGPLGGPGLGYELDLEWVVLWPELAFDFGNRTYREEVDVWLLVARPGVSAVRLIRFARWNLFFGIKASLPVYFHLVEKQEKRVSLGFDAYGVGGANLWLTDRIGLTGRLLLGTHVLNLEQREVGTSRTEWSARLALALQLGVRLRF